MRIELQNTIMYGSSLIERTAGTYEWRKDLWDNLRTFTMLHFTTFLEANGELNELPHPHPRILGTSF